MTPIKIDIAITLAIAVGYLTVLVTGVATVICSLRRKFMTDLEWKQFLADEVVKMQNEHRAFMREAKRGFVFGALGCIALYCALQLIVFLILGEITIP